MGAGDTLRAVSSWGTVFEGRCDCLVANGVCVSVTGRGWIITGKQVLLDPSDPLTEFEALRRVLPGFAIAGGETGRPPDTGITGDR
ncbi:hypothetical protein EAH80_05665 [Mycobacterium hodleri]|uniref:Uncharacterized protein n=2 Tax=Mycolicibacterium hodleri TaxID=49897 RepID=A0A502EL80_9MYCO|nr:hypothetical protein EAH80_05665 [Mycolicibacterium hodleri]